MNRRPGIADVLTVAVALFFVIGYPLLAATMLDRFEPRVMGWVGIALAGVSACARIFMLRPTLRAFVAQYGAGFVLLGYVVLTNDRLGLLLVPALMNFYLALGTGWTLTTEQSLVERVATNIQPRLPDFVRGYCRKVTGLWAAFFTLNALAIAWLACFGAESHWLLYTSKIYFATVVGLTACDFLVRKIYFRNYSNGPIDRVFASLFPAANTVQGRRSSAYLKKMRDLGFKSD